ncbi:MAG: heme exporter protein CcmB [bacterium]
MKAWMSLLKTDLRLFTRSPENIWAMLLFGLLVLVVFNFSLPAQQAQSIYMGSSALLLSLLFSSVLGLPQLQHHHDSVRFLPQLVTGQLTSVGYFWEKFTAGLLLMVISSLVFYPATIVMFSFPASERLLKGAGFLMIGIIGIAVVLTIGSALTVGRESWLLLVLVFPLLLPVVLSTARLIEGAVSSRTAIPDAWAHLLIAYDLLMVFGSWFLSEFLWEDLPEFS